MDKKIVNIVAYPISALILIFFTIFLTVFIDPIEANLAISVPIFPENTILFLPFFFFMTALILVVYSIRLIFKGIRKFIRNSHQFKKRIAGAAQWYLGGKYEILSLACFWTGLLLHNYLIPLIYGPSFLQSFLPNFSYFLITFIFILSPLISFVVLFTGYFIYKQRYEKTRSEITQLYDNPQWIKEQYFTLNRSIQDIADDLGLPMVEVKQKIENLD